MQPHSSHDPPAEATAVVRAVLLTDVVDSTALAVALGEAAVARLWAQHDRVARDLLQQWRGQEIDKTDGLLLLFEQADDAVAYALAYQSALARCAPQLKARAGLHLGRVCLRPNPESDRALGAKPVEVDGAAKAVAARIMSLAQGGQTLLSASARAALSQAGDHLHSHGHWHLKGCPEPIELFEWALAGEGTVPLADQEKAWRVVQRGGLWLPVREIPHNLPAERDLFVGRAAALHHLAKRFEAGARLITLMGPGGMGKTRLATHFAWANIGEFTGGAWFCDLSAARDLDGVVRATAAGLGVQLGQGDAVAQLAQALAGRGDCLLVLDNFEQVSRHAEATLGQWLMRAPKARFLATTREVLGVVGEEVQALAPLSHEDATALFMQRARAAQQGFAPDATEQPSIPPLLRLLEGLPLAIELAAARVRVLSPRALLARMSERFKLLTSRGARVDRQATLKAVFDWSWDLLCPVERAALAQLSIFEGGFDLEAASAVLDLTAFADAPWVVDVMQSLVDKSLLRTHPKARYDLAASLQEYAAEQLLHLDSPPHGAAGLTAGLQARHGLYYASLGELDPSLNTYLDLGNALAACRRAILRADAAVAVRTLEAAWSALLDSGPAAVGIELAQAVHALPGLDATQSARVLNVWARALSEVGDVAQARRVYRHALERVDENARLSVGLYLGLGKLDASQGQLPQALQTFERALALAQKYQDRRHEFDVLNELGSLKLVAGDVESARPLFERALGVARSAALPSSQAIVLGNLGTVCGMLGEVAPSREYFEQALAVARQLGNQRMIGNNLCNLGGLLLTGSDASLARAPLNEALTVARTLGHVELMAVAHCNLGIVDEAAGLLQAAQLHFEQALQLARQGEDLRGEGLYLMYLGALLARQGQHGPAREHIMGAQALLERVGDRYSLGLACCARARTEQLAGCHAAAQSALAQAGQLLQATGAAAESELGQAFRDALASTPT